MDQHGYEEANHLLSVFNSPTATKILLFFMKNPSTTPRELIANIDANPSTIYLVLRRLENCRYIERNGTVRYAPRDYGGREATVWRLRA